MILKEAIQKYGRKNFSREILEWCETEAQLIEREIFWIKHLDARNKAIGYNLSKAHLGKTRTKESNQKTSETLKRKYAEGLVISQIIGKEAWNKGRKVCPEEAERLRNLAKNRIWINNSLKSKMIYPQELESYLLNGWKKVGFLVNIVDILIVIYYYININKL